jgi:hypothetical protein
MIMRGTAHLELEHARPRARVNSFRLAWFIKKRETWLVVRWK